MQKADNLSLMIFLSELISSAPECTAATSESSIISSVGKIFSTSDRVCLELGLETIISSENIEMCTVL